MGARNCRKMVWGLTFTWSWLVTSCLSAVWLPALVGQQPSEAASSSPEQAQIGESAQPDLGCRLTCRLTLATASQQQSETDSVVLAAQSSTDSAEKAEGQKAAGEKDQQPAEETKGKARVYRFQIENVRPGEIFTLPIAPALPSSGKVVVVVEEKKHAPEDAAKSSDQDAGKDQKTKPRTAATFELRVYEGTPSSGDDKKSTQVISVTVTRVEGQPAKITIKRGDQEWTVEEGKLDQLPPDIRALVERHKILLDRFMCSPAAPMGGAFMRRELLLPGVGWGMIARGDFDFEKMQKMLEEHAKRWQSMQEAWKRQQEAIDEARKSLEQARRSLRPAVGPQEQFQKIETQFEQVTKALQELTEEIRGLRKSMEAKKE